MKRCTKITTKYKSVKSIFAHGGDSEKTKSHRSQLPPHLLNLRVTTFTTNVYILNK